MYWKRNHQSDEEFEETLRQNYANKIQGSKVRPYYCIIIFCIRTRTITVYFLMQYLFYTK